MIVNNILTETDIAEARIISICRIFSGCFGALIHVLFFERLASGLFSEMFTWAIQKTGILAWLVFLGFPTFMVLCWTVGMTWPITASRRKVRFVVAFLCFQFLPAVLGLWIGKSGLWGE